MAPSNMRSCPPNAGRFLTTKALSGHAKVWVDLRWPEIYLGGSLQHRSAPAHGAANRSKR